MKSKRLAKNGTSYKIAFPTDIHAPYHDPRAVNLACQIIREYKPDVIINGGDAQDYYTISRFSKDPDRVFLGLQNEIDIFQEVQREINSAAPLAEKYLLIGNHEDRLRRFLWENSELATLRALELGNLMGLDKLGVEPLDKVFVGDTQFTHGDIVRKHSGYSAKGMLENQGYAGNIIMGHTHRMGQVFKTRGDDVVVWGIEAGCLCDHEQAQYISGRANWQPGLVIVDIIDGLAQPQLIPFYKRNKTQLQTIWQGKEFRSK